MNTLFNFMLLLLQAKNTCQNLQINDTHNNYGPQLRPLLPSPYLPP